MGRRKLVLNRSLLKKLYQTNNFSPYKIGKILGCSFTTITNRLIEYHIPLKNPSFARMKYVKKDFNNNFLVKSYMIGFRLGDLNVYKRTKNSETIVVRCHTTQQAQIKVLKSLFDEFGHSTISSNKGHFHINSYLNKSFSFLLNKNYRSWEWIREGNNKLCWSFIGGYTDAEGNFILNQGRARFKIDSYDTSILRWISYWLRKQNINNKFRCISRKGDYLGKNQVWNHDLWRLNINEANSIKKFLKYILPFLRHSKRINDGLICMNNIKQRERNGTIK